MRLAKTALLMAMALGLTTTSALQAQTKSVNAKSKPKSSLTSPTRVTSQGNYGFGIRLGDPTGITFKTYNKPVNVEINFGRSYYGGKRWNEDWFYGYGKYKDRYYYSYYGYDQRYAPISLQLHFLKQKPLRALPEMSIYAGAGPQFRASWAEFAYDRRVYYDRDKYHWVREYDVVMNPDFGLDLVLGLEYVMKDLPLAFSFDGGLFMEFWDEPFDINAQVGLGIKYVF